MIHHRRVSTPQAGNLRPRNCIARLPGVRVVALQLGGRAAARLPRSAHCIASSGSLPTLGPDCVRSATTSSPIQGRRADRCSASDRDTRFWKDKSPFKTAVGIRFPHRSARRGSPAGLVPPPRAGRLVHPRQHRTYGREDDHPDPWGDHRAAGDRKKAVRTPRSQRASSCRATRSRALQEGSNRSIPRWTIW